MMGRKQAGSLRASYVVALLVLGLTVCAAAPATAAGARRLHSSSAQLDSIGLEASSGSEGSAAEFAFELDSLPRLLQEQLEEDAAVAAAEAAQRANANGVVSTPGAYGSLEIPAEETTGSDGITITSDDNVTSDTTEPAAAGSAPAAKPSLEAASRDASQSVAGSSGPVDSQSNAGRTDELSGGQTAGVVVGVLLAAGIAAAGVFAYKRHKRNAQEDYITRYRRYEGGIEMQ